MGESGPGSRTTRRGHWTSTIIPRSRVRERSPQHDMFTCRQTSEWATRRRSAAGMGEKGLREPRPHPSGVIRPKQAPPGPFPTGLPLDKSLNSFSILRNGLSSIQLRPERPPTASPLCPPDDAGSQQPATPCLSGYRRFQAPTLLYLRAETRLAEAACRPLCPASPPLRNLSNGAPFPPSRRRRVKS